MDHLLLKNLLDAAKHVKVEVPDLGYEEPEVVARPIVEQFEEAVQRSSFQARDLAKDLSVADLLGVFERLAARGFFQYDDFDAALRYVSMDVFLENLPSMRPDLAFVVVDNLVRRSYRAHKPMTRSEILDLVVPTRLSGSDVAYLVVAQDGNHLRTNAVGQLDLDAAKRLAERIVDGSVEAFERRLAAVIDEETTALLLAERTRGALALAHRAGSLTDLTWGMILGQVSGVEDHLSLLVHAKSEHVGRSRAEAVEKLVAACVNSAVDETLETIAKKDVPVWGVPLELVTRVNLESSELLVGVLDRVDSFTVRQWASNAYAANPYDPAAAALWASRQKPSKEVADVFRSFNQGFVEIVVANLKGFAGLFRQLLAKDVTRVSAATATLPYVAAVLGDDARLWERLLDGSPNSPYADSRITLGEATSRYLDRWDAAAKRSAR